MLNMMENIKLMIMDLMINGNSMVNNKMITLSKIVFLEESLKSPLTTLISSKSHPEPLMLKISNFLKVVIVIVELEADVLLELL